MGYVPQDDIVHPQLTVRQALYFSARLRTDLSDAEINERTEEVLGDLGIPDKIDTVIGSPERKTLSGGQRKRVNIAQELITDTPLLFLDEPTSGLDPVAAREVHELIIGLKKRGVTIFLTTHRLEEAEKLCDRVAILNTTLRTVGRPEDLRAELFANALVVKTLAPLAEPDRLFGAISTVESWRADDDGTYVVSVSDPRRAAPEVVRALVGAGADLLSIGEAQHSLEEVYLELIDDDVEVARR
jgi:ABC-2 type transport system ATP-binding protein